mmetsp:Transcript_108408/g.313240  ORF Transcript_108408/g.313240 Transcript_108408/m.313240 type:complete len:205 (+) Transcript_108408:1274-1888(+)
MEYQEVALHMQQPGLLDVPLVDALGHISAARPIKIHCHEDVVGLADAPARPIRHLILVGRFTLVDQPPATLFHLREQPAHTRSVQALRGARVASRKIGDVAVGGDMERLSQRVQGRGQARADAVHIDLRARRDDSDGDLVARDLFCATSLSSGADESAEVQDGLREVHGDEVQDCRRDPADLRVPRGANGVGVGRLAEAIEFAT